MNNPTTFNAGHIPWNKGKSHPVARNNVQTFRSGHVSWNRQETFIMCIICSVSFHVPPKRKNTAKFCSADCHKKYKTGRKLERSSKRKQAGNLRFTLEYKTWRRRVFDRDNYTCQACGKRSVALQADHELPYAYYPALRFEVLNGRTLCVPCHRKTPTFATKKNIYYHDYTP